ncbi:hypothetical protein PENTCL1PPCAC_21629, partial [Pristionchus entomophagus]
RTSRVGVKPEGSEELLEGVHVRRDLALLYEIIVHERERLRGRPGGQQVLKDALLESRVVVCFVRTNLGDKDIVVVD